MNNGILAARTQEALAAIENETRRLGGELTLTPSRGDAAHRQLHMLEAIVTALAGIEQPAAPKGEYVALDGVPADAADAGGDVTEGAAPAPRKAAKGRPAKAAEGL